MATIQRALPQTPVLRRRLFSTLGFVSSAANQTIGQCHLPFGQCHLRPFAQTIDGRISDLRGVATVIEQSGKSHSRYERLLAAARELAPIPTAVVHPCEGVSLSSAVEAAELGLIEPILVGPEAKIQAVAAKSDLDISTFPVVSTEHSHDSAARAVALVHEGRAQALMKGSLHTDEVMGAVVARETGLRTSRRVSHCFVMDVPGYPTALIITDAAVNIAPTLEEKVDIVQNAIELAHAIRFDEVRVAILSAMETVTSRVTSTIEAAALARWPIGGRSPARCSTARLRSTMRSIRRRLPSNASSRRSQVVPTCWLCPIWRPATCWPRA